MEKFFDISFYTKLIDSIFKGTINSQQYFEISTVLILISLIITILSALIFLISKIKNSDEKFAKDLVKLAHVRKLKTNDAKNKKLEIKDNESSLKQILIKKFTPKIEKQLKSKIKVKDFNAKGEEFIVKLNVQGHELELKLDSSGKIIDYKKIKN